MSERGKAKLGERKEEGGYEWGRRRDKEGWGHNRQTDRQTDRQTERQQVREGDRETESH